MDIYELLHQDHEEARNVIQQIKGDQSGADVSRYALFSNLSRALAVHMQAEEDTLYAKLGGMDQAHDLMTQSYLEHNNIREVLDEITNMPRGASKWDTSLDRLEGLVNHHVQREEGMVFNTARQLLGESDAQSLGDLFARMKSTRMAA